MRTGKGSNIFMSNLRNIIKYIKTTMTREQHKKVSKRYFTTIISLQNRSSAESHQSFLNRIFAEKVLSNGKLIRDNFQMAEPKQ